MPPSKSPRTPLWRAIATALRDDIAEDRYAPGDKLPTEAALAERFGVNRHTVRHAMAALIDEGLVRTRRGAGAFVAATPTEYPLGARVRFHQNLLAAGRLPERRVLSIELRAASADEARRLALGPGDAICDYRALSLADGQPMALAHSQFPEARLPGFAEVLRRETSITRALAQVGVPDYLRASTRVSARLADATQAGLLHIREGAPLLLTTGINVDLEGRPVEFGMAWFVGDRITLTLDGPAPR